VSKKIKDEIIARANADIAAIQLKLNEMVTARDEVAEDIRRLVTEYESVFREEDERGEIWQGCLNRNSWKTHSSESGSGLEKLCVGISTVKSTKPNLLCGDYA